MSLLQLLSGISIKGVDGKSLLYTHLLPDFKGPPDEDPLLAYRDTPHDMYGGVYKDIRNQYLRIGNLKRIYVFIYSLLNFLFTSRICVVAFGIWQT